MGKEEVFVMDFFCSGIAWNVSFVSLRDRQGDDETCVEGCGYEWPSLEG